MMFKNAIFMLFLLFAVSFILFGMFALPLMDLVRLLAVSLGSVILYVLFYPKVRGVHKGDEVIVIAHSLVPSFLGRKGKLLTNAKGINNEVHVRLDNGTEVLGILESYIDLFSPPRVRLIYEEELIK